MNFHKSEGIAGVFVRAGFDLTDALAAADVILFNTCAVRQKAEEKVYGLLGRIAQLKREKEVLFGFGGCIAQLRGEELLERFPAIDFLFGTDCLGELPHIVNEVAKGGERVMLLPTPTGLEELPYRRNDPLKAMVDISEGCSNFCSYCVIPYSKGLLRSRPPGQVIDEVSALAAAGYKEVLLLGQNVDSYGRDHPEYGGFAALLDEVAQVGIPRVRFISSHPRDMTSQVIAVIAERENVCNHIHLACQSGSNRILRDMNRGYTREQFLTIVDEARREIDGVNITTDLIVGYPGETEEDFLATLELIEEARFGSIFVAMYSPRPRTRSACRPDDVPHKVKHARLQEVLTRQRRIALEENRHRIGAMVPVLVEGWTRSGSPYGRGTDHRTVILSRAVKPGQFVPVRIESATAASLSGRPLVLAGAKEAT
jgi:tRNA-2-methylthio-N6-dimethylallyladenosine synthase